MIYIIESKEVSWNSSLLLIVFWFVTFEVVIYILYVCAALGIFYQKNAIATRRRLVFIYI